MSMSRRRRADVDMVASNLERTNLPGAGETRGGERGMGEEGAGGERGGGGKEEDRYERGRKRIGFGWWIKRVERSWLWRNGEGGSCTSPAKKEELGTDATPLAVDQTPRRTVHLVLLTRKG